MRRYIFLTLLMAFAPLGIASVHAKDIIITHVATKTGPFGAYGNQTSVGFLMGLDHLTKGTMTIAGNKIVVIPKDDQGNPNVAKSLIAAAYADDKSDIVVGPSLSASTLASVVGGRGSQEDLAGRHRHHRFHHRGELEPLRFPNRPHQFAGQHQRDPGVAKRSGYIHRNPGGRRGLWT